MTLLIKNIEDKELQRCYWVWSAMIQRCTNPSNKHYKNYGGRGIKVCDRWRYFRKFSEDMLPRPSGGLLDRKNNDKGYNPSNCRWVNRKEQNSNRRNCIYLMYGKEQITLKEFCRRKKIKYRPFHKRLARGWSFKKALSFSIERISI